MPTFHLDDTPIEFEPGENILSAALRAGIEIPHYCYHPGLQVTAQCRQCLVEVTDMGNGHGIPKLQTSCSTPIADGMKVSATSEKAVWGQTVVNEFLLVNHPLDCPICDQAGECDLQNFAFKYGSGHSEMDYEKRVYGWREVGSFIVLERNRCIQCSRCERFSRDIGGSHDFGSFLRSHELTFDTFEDAQITHKFQGNLSDICPVGCIMNRDWRFKKRAWKLNKTRTVCPTCSTGCNVTLEHHDNRVFRIKPRENPEVNRWWMCDEGRLNYTYLRSKEELEYDYVSPSALPNAVDTASLSDHFQPLRFEDHVLDAQVWYQWTKWLESTLFYRLQRSTVKDFQQKDLQPRVNQNLLLAHTDENYTAHVFGASIGIRF